MRRFKRHLCIFVLLHLPVSSFAVITRDFIIEDFKAGICKRGTDDAILSSTSYAECISECRARSQCVSVSYLTRTQMCRLNFDSEDQTTTRCAYYSYTEKAVWNQKIKKGCESTQCENNQRCETTSEGPKCVNIECRRISSIENGVVYGNDARKGKKVAFACNYGYVLKGSKSLTCTPDDIWSDVEPVCVKYPAKTCAGLVAFGLNQSTESQIDPLGTGGVTVYCDFDLVPGKAVTVLHHNMEVVTLVNGYEQCGSYSVDLEYDIGLEQVKMVADLSAECKQNIKWDCRNSKLTACAWWSDRHGTKSTYFTGSPTSGKNCACGETNSCDETVRQCNCDVNDSVWRFDEGYVTDKNVLPIIGFFAGDTGSTVEEGYHTIGPLLCF